MTPIYRLLVPLALLASILPSVIAGNSDCQPDEYWYDNRGCCVPRTPPSNPSNPPAGKSCPSSDYYWSGEKSCCLPIYPPPPYNPPPTCPWGHTWNDKDSCCDAPPPSNCNDDDFWYDDRSCCLPYGGPPSPPSPPTGSECPPDVWYWHIDKKCCVPYHPNPPSPECPYGWVWNDWNYKCQPASTPPSPKNPQPSGYYGRGWKRAQKPRANTPV